MFFNILKSSRKSSLRKGKITTKHGTFNTPAFMPVGTKGTVKAISPEELKNFGFEVILANTYHLYLRPGDELIKKQKGLHYWMKWDGPILTDSGGFQVYSLREEFVRIRQNGVEFKSHLDGSQHFLTPEKVIQIQMNLGSDILMPLDICLPANASKNEQQKAVEKTIKWLIRSQKYLQNQQPRKKSALFGIIQGGIYPDLRKDCAQKVLKLNLDGYAIGGLAVGEKKKDLWKIVKLMDKILPKNKPRYLMGVGEPEDLIKATNLGMDMFDCVLPTRLARHGTVWTTSDWKKFPKIDFRKSNYQNDPQPIMANCQCYTCKNQFSKSYLTHLIREKEILGIRLLTYHNLWLIHELIRKIQTRFK